MLFGSVFWPVWFVVGLAPADVQLGAPTLIFALLLYPLAVIMHELGHAVTAHLIGLEVGGIGVGFGRVIWQREIRGLPVRLHSWPLSGRVYLGAPNTHLLRTRFWITTLMGPMTNVLLACAAAIWWKPLVSFFGSTVVYLWWTVNLFLAVIALYPRRIRDVSYFVFMASDGLALFQIPRWSTEKLELCLHSAPVMRAMAHYEHGDFAGALSVATRALARTPNVVTLQLIQAASYLYVGEYQHGVDVARLVLNGPSTQQPAVRATIQINLAFGLAMSNLNAGSDNPQLQEAERMSRDAVDTFPCLLEFRCTRALVLAVIGRAEEALQVLDYIHFDTGTRRQRAQRQTARAAALRGLNRTEEAEEAAALAVQLDRASLKIVQSLGFSPNPGMKVIEPRLRRRPVHGLLEEELEPLSGGASVLARISGAVLIMFGLGLGALGCLGLLRQVESVAAMNQMAIAFIVVLVLLSSFCLVVGYRLALNRPNRYGSILPPSAWAALAGLFGVAGLAFLAPTFTAPARGPQWR